MKTRFPTLFLFIFLFVACNLRPTTVNPTIVPTVLTNSLPTVENIKLTEQALVELCQSVGHQGLANFYPNVHYSPSREWSFISCENFSNDETTYPFVISRVPKKSTQILVPKVVAPDWIANFPSTNFTPKYWSNDEIILIINAFLFPCPDSFLCLYEDGEALYEINLESGEFSTLLPLDATSSYAFSVSPDGKYLGYVNQATPETVHIRDLTSGNEKTNVLQGKYLRVGAFVWTPDSKELLFFGISYIDDVFHSSLFLYDSINSSLSMLLDRHSGTYFPGDLTFNKSDYWYQQDVLYLGSTDSPHLYINIRTKELDQVPTSQP